ncbi:hypothetical protein HYN56_07975 [Flavobacterium crocinum]|uniref:Uncharacterized protein n=1 Tax=Flavobacterium crocinum TaxID=2183896 RepID=A0A2S1YJF8_9FLAO|nr:hypothetical protein HYN56_07975 [Flavobacterium crocinum]
MEIKNKRAVLKIEIALFYCNCLCFNLELSFRRNVSLVEEKYNQMYLRSIGTFDMQFSEKTI